MKVFLIYESYLAKFYNHEPLGKARVPNEMYAIDLYFQLVYEGYSKNLYVCEEKQNKPKPREILKKRL